MTITSPRQRHDDAVLADEQPWFGRFEKAPAQEQGAAAGAAALAVRAALPFMGLRNRVIDPRLLAYVPANLAAREHVMAVDLIGDTLIVATSTPDPDLRSVADRFPHLEVQLVIAREDEIAAALAHTDRRRA